MSVEMPQNYPLVTWRDNSHGGVKAIESSWILLGGPGWVSSKCQFCPIGLPSIGGLHGSCGVLSSLLIVEASLFEGLSVSSPTLKNLTLKRRLCTISFLLEHATILSTCSARVFHTFLTSNCLGFTCEVESRYLMFSKYIGQFYKHCRQVFHPQNWMHSNPS